MKAEVHSGPEPVQTPLWGKGLDIARRGHPWVWSWTKRPPFLICKMGVTFFGLTGLSRDV